MKIKTLLIFILITIFSNQLKSQIQYSPILIGSKGLFNKQTYTRCDIEMTNDQLVALFAKDVNMNAYTVPLVINNLINKILIATGTALISIPLVDVLQSNDKPNWNLAYIGASCIVVSIPFRIAFQKRAYKAISYYNSRYAEVSSVNIKFKFSASRFAVNLNF